MRKTFRIAVSRFSTLGECKDLLGLRVVAENLNKYDTVVILPSASAGYEQLWLDNCTVKGAEEIGVIPSKITLGGENIRYVRINDLKVLIILVYGWWGMLMIMLRVITYACVELT